MEDRVLAMSRWKPSSPTPELTGWAGLHVTYPVQQRGEEILGGEQMEALVLLVVLPGADGVGAGGARRPQPVHVRLFLLFRLPAAHKAAATTIYYYHAKPTHLKDSCSFYELSIQMEKRWFFTKQILYSNFIS